MKFEASDEQVKKMAALAVNASEPMGLGHFHFQPGETFKPEEFDIEDRGIFLDYVQGRMVKLYIHKRGPGEWEVTDRKPTPDYQSWCRKYPTYEALIKAAK